MGRAQGVSTGRKRSQEGRWPAGREMAERGAAERVNEGHWKQK